MFRLFFAHAACMLTIGRYGLPIKSETQITTHTLLWAGEDEYLPTEHILWRDWPMTGCIQINMMAVNCNAPSSVSGIGVCSTNVPVSWFNHGGQSTVNVTIEVSGTVVAHATTVNRLELLASRCGGLPSTRSSAQTVCLQRCQLRQSTRVRRFRSCVCSCHHVRPRDMGYQVLPQYRCCSPA